MANQKNKTESEPLARHLRIGLLGSPYDWGALDFDSWKAQNIDLNLTAFAGSSDANVQDLLMTLKTDWSSTSQVFSVWQNDFSVLQCDIAAWSIDRFTPTNIETLFVRTLAQTNAKILSKLKEHDDKYLSAETIIARYGTQVLRVGTLLNNPQIHIENEALAYLIETPWRNCSELDYVISKMVFHLEGDILRKPFVQNFVYEFGTSLRGVSNSNVAKTLIHELTREVVSKYDFKTASELFAVNLDRFSINIDDDLFKESKRAA